MSLEEYEDVLSRINRVRKISSLLSEDRVGLVANSAFWIGERYENAYVYKGLYRSETTTIRSFDVYYLHPVTGVVEMKVNPNDTIGTYQGTTKIKVSGHWYWLEQAASDRVRVGQKVRMKMAGPVD